MRASAKFPAKACPGRAACYGRYRDGRSRRSEETTMKRAVITCLLTLVALSMTGCPIYPSDNLCHSHWDCAQGYTCDDVTGACVPYATGCTRPADCTNVSETCTSEGICQIGSCRQLGCVAGYGCVVDDVSSAWTCVPGSAQFSAGGSTGSGGASSVAGSSATGGASGTGATAGASATGGAGGAGGASTTGGADAGAAT